MPAGPIEALTNACNALSADTLASTLVGALARRQDWPALRSGLMVRLANTRPPTMFGEELVDTLHGADETQRLSYQLTPFARITGGGVSVVVAQNEQGEPHILLAKKRGAKHWTLSGGFMDPMHAQHMQGKYAEDTAGREQYEIGLMQTGQTSSAKPINRLVDNPTEFDKDLESTALRELKEETGIAVDRNQLQLTDSMTVSNNTDGSNFGKKAPYQQQTNAYLVDLRDKGTLPTLVVKEGYEDFCWAKLSDIDAGGEHPAYQNVPIFNLVTRQLEKSLAFMREKELAVFGVTREGILPFSHDKQPASEMGKAALAWHKDALAIAAVMQQKLTEHMPKGEGKER